MEGKSTKYIEVGFNDYLSKPIEKLELKDVKAVHGRAEEFGIKPDYRQQYDIATARAVARMPVLLEICLPFVKKGGILIALKGPELENELKESTNALKELGGKVVDVQEFTLADGAYTRNLAVIEKVKDTQSFFDVRRERFVICF